jgi:hypothetical protein
MALHGQAGERAAGPCLRMTTYLRCPCPFDDQLQLSRFSLVRQRHFVIFEEPG